MLLNIKKITDFFNFTSTEEADSTFENENSPIISESSQASEDELNPQTNNQESDDDKDFNKEYLLSDNELIKEIENKINDNRLPFGLKWKLTAVLQYLRLIKFNKSKIQASLSVARQLGRNTYLARSIREWTNVLKAGDSLPESFRGRHPKIKSLLEDEDIQAEIVLYLRENKFEFYIADFVNYVSDVILPKLGIERAKKIG